MLNAILCVEGLSIKDNLYRVDYKLYDIHVCGYIGSPDITYKRNSSKVYINTRIIKSDIVSNAVLKAYGERLLKGSLPFYVLNIKMDPKDVDVNVHPNKLSVHFKDDSLIYNAINCAVYESLNNNILSPVFDIEHVTKSDVVNTVSEPILYDSVSDNLSKINCDNDKRLDTDDIKKYIADVMDISTSYMNAGTLSFNQTRSNFNNFSIKTDENSVKEFEQPVIINESPDYILIGTVFECYIIVEVNETIYIIDQHALHERFIYDSIRKDMGAGVPIQQFLVSDAVKLSHVEYEAIENNLDLLKKSGFDLEVFGELTIKINAVPVYVEFVNSSVLLHDIADELLIGNKNFTNEILSEKIAKAACKRAVKSTWKLPPDAIDGLVKEIIDCDTIPCCPHGRPVAIAFTKKQLEKSFKRRL